MTNRVSDSNSFFVFFVKILLTWFVQGEYTNSGFRYIIEEKSITKGGE